MAHESQPQQLALWCLVGKDKILAVKSNIPELDRTAWMLPRLEAQASPTQERGALEAYLAQLGLNATRQPVALLGSPILQAHGAFQRIKLYAVTLPASSKNLPDNFEFVSIAGSKKTKNDDGSTIHIDALLDCGSHLYYAQAGQGPRPIDTEVFASIPIHSLRDEYFNLWFPDAIRELEPLGIEIEIDTMEPNQPMLRISGRAALLPQELDAIRSRLIDLGRHARGRFWVTEIINGHEALLDFADPATARKLASGALS